MSGFMPYVGLDEVTKDKVGTAKALIAECLGTLLLVKFTNIFSSHQELSFSA